MMQSSTTWTAALAGPLLAVVLATAAAGEPCAGLEVRAGDMIFTDGFESGSTAAWGAPEPWFSATRILDLDLLVRLSEDFSGDHLLHVKLLTPKGHHYQTLTVPIASDEAQAGSKRPVDGFPRPLAVQVLAATESGNGGTIVQQLPVAGTSIVSSALYGRWTAQAYLDAEVVACTEASFVLTP